MPELYSDVRGSTTPVKYPVVGLRPSGLVPKTLNSRPANLCDAVSLMKISLGSTDSAV